MLDFDVKLKDAFSIQTVVVGDIVLLLSLSLMASCQGLQIPFPLHLFSTTKQNTVSLLLYV